MKLTEGERHIIWCALKEYEDNHYTMTNEKWKETINKLIEYFS